jgi:hypothetical protein
LFVFSNAQDGNYILAGIRFYFIKIDDDGDIIWQKSFLGFANINHVESTEDYEFLLSGEARNTCSRMPPDKTEANLGRYQTWFVKPIHHLTRNEISWYLLQAKIMQAWRFPDSKTM